MAARFRMTRIVFLAMLGVVAAYGVLGGFVAPRIARHLLVDDLSTRLGRRVELDRIVANPYTLQVRAEGFRVFEADGKSPFAAFDTLDLDGSILSLRHLAPVVDEARLRGLRVRLVRDDAGRYNFADIAQRLAAAARQPHERHDEPARFSLANLQLDGGSLEFDDRPAHALHRVGDMRLAIPLVSNLPIHRRDRVKPHFSAVVNGAPLELQGEALPFENTVRTNFTLDVKGVDVPRYLGYLPPDFPVRFDRGSLDARIALRFTQAPGQEATVDLAGTAALSGLALATGDGALADADRVEAEIASADPFHGRVKLAKVTVAHAKAMKGQWRLDAVAARDIDIDLATHAVKVGAIEGDGAKIAVERRADGSFAYPTLPPSREPTHWSVALGRLALARYSIAVQDDAVKPARRHEIELAAVEGRDLGTEPDLGGTLEARGKVARAGTFALSSKFTVEPLEVTAKIDARGIDLVPLRAYVAQFPAVALRSASASAQGTLALRGKPGALEVRYDGTAEVDRLATFDTLNREDLLNWKRVKATGIRLGLVPDAPLRLAIADVDVEGAYSRIVVTPKGQLNVQQLIAATPADPEPAPATREPRPRDIRIDRVRFEGSRLDFTDHYIRPNYSADVGDVKGAVTGLSSDPASRATVMLAGRWDTSSPVVIAGTVNPLAGNLFLDIAAQGKDIDLTHLTAYSQRYAGYGIKAGRLTLDVKYHVADGKMEGRNRILVDQLAFGDKVESPDATSLPVLFVVNLLKDKDGRINLELPVSGSLDDPKFEIGAVIAQVFSKHFAKAQSSPFALLAGGGEGADDLGFVDFEAGQSQLSPAAQARLDKLVALLQDRPGLKLEIQRAHATPADVQALAAALRAQRLAAAPKEMPKEAREKLAAQPVEVPEEAKQALAHARMESVRAYLSGESRLAAERVAIGEPAGDNGAAATPAASRVALALR